MKKIPCVPSFSKLGKVEGRGWKVEMCSTPDFWQFSILYNPKLSIFHHFCPCFFSNLCNSGKVEGGGWKCEGGSVRVEGSGWMVEMCSTPIFWQFSILYLLPSHFSPLPSPLSLLLSISQTNCEWLCRSGCSRRRHVLQTSCAGPMWSRRPARSVCRGVRCIQPCSAQSPRR